MNHGRTGAGRFHEPIGPGAGLIVHVPVPAGGELDALGHIGAECVNVAQEQNQCGKGLAALGHTELTGGVDGVGGVGTGVGQGDHISARGLRLQDEGGEVRGRERMANAANHFTAVGFHNAGNVRFHGMAEGVIGGQDEPGFAAFLHDRCRGTDGQRVGVIDIVDMVRRAMLVGDAGCGRAGYDAQLVVLFQNLGGRDGHRRCDHTADHVDLVVLNPAANRAGGHVRAVPVVGADDFDLGALDRATEILDGHFHGLQAVRAGQVPVGTGHIRQVTHFYHVVANLRLGATHHEGGCNG